MSWYVNKSVSKGVSVKCVFINEKNGKSYNYDIGKEYILDSSYYDENAPHGYGPAVLATFESFDGKLWVWNDEYCSQINFCPFTGYEAKVKIDTK